MGMSLLPQKQVLPRAARPTRPSVSPIRWKLGGVVAAERRVPNDIEGAFDPPETHRNFVDLGAQILDFRSYGVIRRGDSNKDGDAGSDDGPSFGGHEKLAKLHLNGPC